MLRRRSRVRRRAARPRARPAIDVASVPRGTRRAARLSVHGQCGARPAGAAVGRRSRTAARESAARAIHRDLSAGHVATRVAIRDTGNQSRSAAQKLQCSPDRLRDANLAKAGPCVTPHGHRPSPEAAAVCVNRRISHAESVVVRLASALSITRAKRQVNGDDPKSEHTHNQKNRHDETAAENIATRPDALMAVAVNGAAAVARSRCHRSRCPDPTPSSAATSRRTSRRLAPGEDVQLYWEGVPRADGTPRTPADLLSDPANTPTVTVNAPVEFARSTARSPGTHFLTSS